MGCKATVLQTARCCWKHTCKPTTVKAHVSKMRWEGGGSACMGTPRNAQCGHHHRRTQYCTLVTLVCWLKNAPRPLNDAAPRTRSDHHRHRHDMGDFRRNPVLQPLRSRRGLQSQCQKRTRKPLLTKPRFCLERSPTGCFVPPQTREVGRTNPSATLSVR